MNWRDGISLSLWNTRLEKQQLPATLRTTFHELGRMSLYGVVCCICFLFILAACLLRCLRYELFSFVNI